jgi:hypothetical protein
MTKTPNSTLTTTQIRHGGSIALSISCDFTDSGISMPQQVMLQSLIVPVITQWWNGLTHSQRSLLAARGLNLSISGRYRS